MSQDKKTKETKLTPQAAKESVAVEAEKTKGTQWGLALILIVIGSVLVLDSLNIAKFDFNFWSLVKLWPLLLVSAGLGILGSRNKVLKTVATIGNLLLLVFAGLVITGLIRLDSPVNIETKTINSEQSIQRAKVDIKSAGKLIIGAHDEAGTVKYSGANLIGKSNVTGEQENILIEHESTINLSDLNTEVTLNKTLPIELGIDFGAGSVDADLRGLSITRLDVDSGISDITIKLDSTVNRNVYIDLDLGISKAEIYVPKTVGVRLTSDSGMSSIGTNGLESRGNNIYETPNISDFSTIYEIKLDSGMTNFELKYL
ncbi:MAG: LiaI-LiaF-like domain-containing protein [Candidatus Nanosyncoccaceae bacterium]|jgi:hypothetical protein